MQETVNFGNVIKEARKKNGYTQRQLAEILGIDFTYLSKLENNRGDSTPKEELIRYMALYLGLDEDELIFLAGKIPSEDEELIKQHYQQMPLLFRRMRENPEFAAKIFQQVKESSEE